MSGLDIFALIISIVLVMTVLGIWALLGMYPGRIARRRKHPQADAIYTDSVAATRINRKVMMRMEAWMSYIKA